MFGLDEINRSFCLNSQNGNHLRVKKLGHWVKSYENLVYAIEAAFCIGFW